MNDKKSIDNFKRVVELLKNDKNLMLFDMNQLKFDIERKVQSINKIIQYREEMGRQVQLQVPALMQNMGEFRKKIEKAITAGQCDIEELEQRKIKIIQYIHQVDKKINSITLLIDKQEKKIRILDENREIERDQDLCRK